MKYLNLLICVIGAIVLSSCIKDEALNAECDIEEAVLHVSDPSTYFYNLTDSLVRVPSSDSTIVFNVRRNADLSAMAPVFKLTAGASISPASGTVRDFSQGAQTYVVTSEDQQWKRTYRVSFNPILKTVSDTTTFSFENFSLESREQKYYVWNQADNNAEDGENMWTTANAGYRLSMSTAKPEDYPTVPVEGYQGMGVKLTTRDTGPFGVMANKRIAAGNLFRGSFDLTSALINTLHATHFGMPYDRMPVRFKGYYKYTPGEKFQDAKGNTVAGRVDQGAIYAVLYRNHDAEGNSVVLYGDDVKTSKQIVAIADFVDIKSVSEWTAFDIPFVFNEEIDYSLLENRGYSLAIVCSSSSEGDQFIGAIGSTLYVDELQIICQKED